jgi:hypothetical protein
MNKKEITFIIITVLSLFLTGLYSGFLLGKYSERKSQEIKKFLIEKDITKIS